MVSKNIKFSTSFRILVVDDGSENRKLACTFLDYAGLATETATDGRDAIEKVVAASTAGRSFDAVLMDMQMPILDGYAATAELRKLGHTDLPVIAFTAHAMASDRERCMQAGCNDYVTKPIDRAEMVSAFARVFKVDLALEFAATDRIVPATSCSPGFKSILASDPLIRSILPG